MIQNLTAQNIKVPNGFAVTVDAYDDSLKENNLKEKINVALDGLDTTDIIQLRKKQVPTLEKLISNGKISCFRLKSPFWNPIISCPRITIKKLRI